ncbi:MAG: hypothetical protein A4E44_01069 [Methanosaeta sp. PtaB.Bin018]|nr:Hsp20/alpha crystallin family protein [Methanothrix sp.]OPX75953.1 MAG: hypothetical protein A4E44_01069 [Methanosaeta sp. PtaB.Bin018]OPY43687.1 MAG: hypothetical protein A4E46_01701 [Methanosaeta sp. PtaU1.Bin016]HOV52591.1 Hsp20/alpha crystallin family protein [Methanothrix sp.]
MAKEPEEKDEGKNAGEDGMAPEKGDKGEESDKEESKRLEERIALLEKKIDELEKESRRPAEGVSGERIVESVVGQFIPGLGGIIKALEGSSPEFRQRIAETDAEIRHRIDVGWSSKPVIDYQVSTRPIRRGQPRTESVRLPRTGPTRDPIVDVLEGKDGITVIAELPGVSEEELRLFLDRDALEISAGQFSKKVTLPRTAKSIVERSFKNGILQIRLK